MGCTVIEGGRHIHLELNHKRTSDFSAMAKQKVPSFNSAEISVPEHLVKLEIPRL